MNADKASFFRFSICAHLRKSAAIVFAPGPRYAILPSGGDVAAPNSRFDRIVWIVLDSVGIGELPDAADYGDTGRDTLGHIARSRPLRLPNLLRLGLGNIKPLANLAPPASPQGSFGKS